MGCTVSERLGRTHRPSSPGGLISTTANPERVTTYPLHFGKEHTMPEQKRWWLWEWDTGGSMVSAYFREESNLKTTEVILVPVHSREWAVIQAMRGARVRPKGNNDSSGWLVFDIAVTPATEWELVPPAPPPWVPTRGEKVRWYSGGCEGTAFYERPATRTTGHVVTISSGVAWYVEGVERLEGAESAWLIEATTPDGRSMWWTGSEDGEWSFNSRKAVRYASRQDAEAQINAWHPAKWPWSKIVAEEAKG
jgi:hypothetical protein